MSRAYTVVSAALLLLGVLLLFGAWNVGMAQIDAGMAMAPLGARLNFGVTGAAFLVAGWAGLGLGMIRSALADR